MTLTLPDDASIVLPHGVVMDDDEARAVRRHHLGASQVATLLGLNPYETPYRLWLDKMGHLDGPGRFTGNDATEWGHLLEDDVATWFARHNPEWEVFDGPGSIVRASHPLIITTPDRVLFHAPTATPGVLECKTGGEYTKKAWIDPSDPDAMPQAYIVQNLIQMWATGTITGYVAAVLGGSTPVARAVEWDAGTADDIIDYAETWWAEHIVGDTPPPVDGSEGTMDVLSALYRDVTVEPVDLPTDALDLWAEAKAGQAAEKAAKAQVDTAKNALRAMLGEFTDGYVDDRPVATWRQTGQFDAARFTADHPDLAAELTKTVTVLDVDAVKKQHPALYTAYRGRVLRLAPNPSA